MRLCGFNSRPRHHLTKSKEARVYACIFANISPYCYYHHPLLLLGAGWRIRRLCFKIILKMEEAKAFSAATAIYLSDTRANFFKVGTHNLYPKALNVLLADELAVKAHNGKYYLNKDKLAAIQNKINSQEKNQIKY